jgi:hypothetical protein
MIRLMIRISANRIPAKADERSDLTALRIKKSCLSVMTLSYADLSAIFT